MDWKWIDNDLSFQDVINSACDVEAISVDTEFVRERTFYPRIALLQICTGKEIFLIDPQEISDLAVIKKLFLKKSVMKVFHSCAEDLEVLRNWLGVIPEPVFDTQIAASLLDIGFSLSYAKLVKEVCSIELKKSQTRSDWLKRPLTSDQCRYAAQDVQYLYLLWKNLSKEADKSRKMSWILSDSEILSEDLRNFKKTDHLRIPVKNSLSRLQLSQLYSVSKWREREARTRNLPRRWILDDKSCRLLVEASPSCVDDLSNIPGFPTGVSKRYSKDLLAIFRRSLTIPEAELPPQLPAPLSKDGRRQVLVIKQLTKKIASNLGVTPEILVKARDFNLLVRVAAGEKAEIPGYWQGWRKDLVIWPLRQYLEENHQPGISS